MREFIRRVKKGINIEAQLREAQERLVAEEQARQEAQQEMLRQQVELRMEALLSLAPLAGRFALVSNFSRLQDNELFPANIIDTQAATVVEKIMAEMGEKVGGFGVSSHANKSRMGKAGVDPYQTSAYKITKELYSRGFPVIPMSGFKFENGLGVDTIISAVQEAPLRIGVAPERVGHIAVVSALYTDEVGIEYPDPGEIFLLQGAERDGDAVKFDWEQL